MTNAEHTSIINRLRSEFPFQLALQIATTVIVVIAAYFISRKTILAICIAIGVVLTFSLGFFFGRRTVTKLLRLTSIAKIYPFIGAPPPIEKIPINQRVRSLETEFLFMGVSAKILWSTNIFQMMANPEFLPSRFRFLLLDPARQAIVRKMRDEGLGGSPAAAKRDVLAFINHHPSIKESLPGANIECHLYDIYPGFWLLLCDDTLYVQPFPKRTVGKNSSLIVLKDAPSANGAFFEGFMNQVEDIWSHQSKSVL